jgi:hypothetical protein
MLWRFTSITALITATYAIWVSVKQHHDMWEAAGQIVQRAEKRGCQTTINQDGSISIEIDGELVEVIPESVEQV